MAEEAGMDLVEIAPTAKPPVCRLMDFGKFKYCEAKKRHEAKLKQKQIQVKEDQVPAWHRRRRLPDQAAQLDPLPGRGRQGEGDVAFPGP